LVSSKPFISSKGLYVREGFRDFMIEPRIDQRDARSLHFILAKRTKNIKQLSNAAGGRQANPGCPEFKIPGFPIDFSPGNVK
jgi:hypothetical protein